MDPQGWLWNFLTVGGAITAVVVSIGAFVRSLRRQPPLTEEIYKEFATKDDLTKLRDETKADFEKLKDNINHSLSSGEKLFREIDSSVSKIEGKMEVQLAQCNRVCNALIFENNRHHEHIKPI